MVLTATVKNKALMSMKQPMGITYMALRRRSPDEKKDIHLQRPSLFQINLKVCIP